MGFIKKQSAGVWVTLVAVLLAIASVIVYAVNVSSDGYFKGAAVSNITVYIILAAVLHIAVICLGQLKLKGFAATAVKLVSGIMQIAVPALLALCLINLVASRVEGLGFIYFSNADVLLEVQTPENLSSASGSIASMVCLGIAVFVSMVASFFNPVKKEA